MKQRLVNYLLTTELEYSQQNHGPAMSPGYIRFDTLNTV